MENDPYKRRPGTSSGWLAYHFASTFTVFSGNNHVHRDHDAPTPSLILAGRKGVHCVSCSSNWAIVPTLADPSKGDGSTAIPCR